MKILISILALLLCGCVPTIEGKNIFSQKTDASKLKVICEELASIGNASELIDAINQDAQQILTLLNEEDPSSVLAEVKRLKHQIQGNVKTLSALLGPKFTDANFKQEIKWVATKDDYQRFLPVLRQWHLTDSELAAGYDLESGDSFEDGASNKDLLRWTSSRISGSKAIFSFSRPASALQLCQLQNTIGFKARLDFENGDGKHQTHLRVKLIIEPWRKQ